MGFNKRYGFVTGNGASLEKGLRFLSYPQFSYGCEEFEIKKIAGRKGALTIPTGKMSDTVIRNEMEFIGESVERNESKKYEILRWLKSIEEISYTDVPDKYFKVKRVEIDDSERKHKVFNSITVSFICEPGVYLREGDEQQNIKSGAKLINNYSVAAPVYKISGEGMLNLTVNGKTVNANVGQNLTIDTELMIAYREDGTKQNTALTGSYEDLLLKEGENVISFAPTTFTVQIIPRWRLLL